MNVIHYRKDIDALRGLSILLVVVFHVFPNILPGGFIGVDVFFVISGFLITKIISQSIQQDEFSFISFYDRRIRRLFPALLTILTFTLLLGWLVLFPDEYMQLGWHVFRSSTYTQNFNLINEAGYFDVNNTYKPLLHLWSLSIEEQYYLLWPLALLISLKQRLVKAEYLILLILIISFLVNIYLISHNLNKAYFHTLSRVWQLAAGSLFALVLHDNTLKQKKSLLVLGLALIIAAAFLITEKTIYPGWIALLPTLGALLVISSNIQLKKWYGLVYLGLISYPLYLWHWVILCFVYIYLGGRVDNAALVIVVFVSMFLAHLTYSYIEKIRYVRNKIISILLLLIGSSIAFSGYYIFKNDGLSGRNHIEHYIEPSIQFKRTSISDSACQDYSMKFLQKLRTFTYCRTQYLSSSKYIAVIGDSHAHALFPGIAEQAKLNGYGTILLANSSCPPLAGFLWGRTAKEIQSCQKKIEEILSIVNLDTRIKKVLLVTRGPVYIHGEVQGEFTIKSIEKSMSDITNKVLTNKAYMRGLKNTVTKLQNSKHVESIYYILENPELDFLPKETIVRPFDLWGVSSRNRTVSKDFYQLRMRSYQADIAAFSHQIQVIDTTPYFCEQKKCYSFKEGQFMYADKHHLSIFGSKYIANKISKDIFND